MRSGVEVAEFADPFEARLARDYLWDAGIEAWLEGPGPDRRIVGEGARRVALVVPEGMGSEARALLAEMAPVDRPDEVETAPTGARPLWIPLVAAVVAAGLVIGAVPSFLWPWVILVAFVGFLLWRAVGPRTPR